MSPEYDRSTDRGLLLAHLAAWRVEEILKFMRDQSIAGRSAAKDDLLATVERAVQDGSVSDADLVQYLDEIEPRGKQHVFVIQGSEDAGNRWASPADAQARLGEAGRHDLWEAHRPLVGPAEVEISSVSMRDGSVEIYGVSRKLYLKRREDLEGGDTTRRGVPVIEQVFEKVWIRAWTRLLWDVQSGQASLHIAQLPTKRLYSEAQTEFFAAIRPFFPVDA